MKTIILVVNLLFFSFFASAQKLTVQNLRSGDLIFIGAEKINLSGAINRVTQRQDSIAFDHIAIVEKTNDSLYVLHASTKNGSVKENIQSFYKAQKNKDNRLAVYRLKDDYQKAIPNALIVANTMLGKPYNWSYILNEERYYCSDFIERAFRKDHIFTLEPMTFVNPKTGKIDDFWVEFYKKQNLEVPEGKPGCNPNGLAHSNKLAFIGNLSN